MFPKKYLLICLVLFATIAVAQEERANRTVFDLTFQVGSLDIEERNDHILSVMQKADGDIVALTDLSYDWSETALRLAETMHINKHLAVEGALAYFGETKMTALTTMAEQYTDPMDGAVYTTADQPALQNLVVRYSGFELYAMGKLPLFGEKLVAYGKVGGTYSRVEYTVDSLIYLENVDPAFIKVHSSENEDDLAGSFGAGLYSVINDKLVVRLDFVSTRYDQQDVTTTSLGLGFRY